MKITVTKEEKKFKPFILSLKVENLDELNALYNRFNMIEIYVKENLKDDYRRHNSYKQIRDIFELLYEIKKEWE